MKIAGSGMAWLSTNGPTRGENLAERLRRAKHGHYECEDCWYSCATICCDEMRRSDKCDCGADELNALLEEAAAAIELVSRPQSDAAEDGGKK